jgi:O-antigen ligase
MNFKATLSKFLTNKWVLKIVALLAFLNVIGYLIMGNLNTVLSFVIVAVLVRYFSKNMIIVLGIPLILVNLLSLKGIVYEGLENNSTTTTPDSTTETSSDASKESKPVNKPQDAKSKQ